MTRAIRPETQMCVSFSARPSPFGTKFHNGWYEKLGLDFVYKAFAITDIKGAIQGMRALGLRGAAISMPFKQSVMPLLDEIDPLAQKIGAVNTIVNTGGHLKGYNTDYLAVKALIEEKGISPSSKAALLGSGGMSRAIACALADLGFKNASVVARNKDTGTDVAKSFGLAYEPELKGRYDFYLNATPLGMSPQSDVLALEEARVKEATAILDSVAHPPETPLAKIAIKLGKTLVRGDEIVERQAREQFFLYTGVKIP